MRWLAPLALTACNSIFGNRESVERDARFFDAPADGAVHCPSPVSPPQFSPILHPVIDQNCVGYAVAADTHRAYAACAGAVYAGNVDDRLDEEPGLPRSSSDGAFSIADPRVSPEGDLLLLGTFDLVQTLSTYRSYTPSAAGWVRGPDLPLPQYENMSVPSRGPDRRVIAYDKNIGQEYRQDPDGSWRFARDVAFGPEPGVHIVWLASDALRLISYEAPTNNGEARLYYAYRETRDEDFSAPVLLDGIPVAGDLFITEDCTRVYMTSVHTIFYALGK